MKTIAVIGAGISGLAAATLLSRRHRVHLFEQERRLGGHTNTVVLETRAAACRSTPAFWSTTTAPIRTWCGCSGNSAWPPATRTCRSPCRAGGAGSSTAAAAPTGSSPSGGTWSDRRTCSCCARSCASIGRRRRCSVRRMRNARRWATFSSPAVSARVSPTSICCPWRRPSGRPLSTRSVVSRAHAHSLLRQPRAALAQCAADMEGRRRRQPYLHSQTHRALSGGIHEGAAIQAVRRSEGGVTLTFRDRPRWGSTRSCSRATAIRCCRSSPIRAIASATCSRASRPRPTSPGCTRTSVLPARGPARPGTTGSRARRGAADGRPTAT